MRRYEDLKVWQKAVELADAVYKYTRPFPREEIYGLSSQMRRAAVSVSSNIAEGSERDSDVEFIRFINIARGSLAEVKTQLIIVENNNLSSEDSMDIKENIDEISRMLSGLKRGLSRKPNLETSDSRLVTNG